MQDIKQVILKLGLGNSEGIRMVEVGDCSRFIKQERLFRIKDRVSVFLSVKNRNIGYEVGVEFSCSNQVKRQGREYFFWVIKICWYYICIRKENCQCEWVIEQYIQKRKQVLRKFLYFLLNYKVWNMGIKFGKNQIFFLKIKKKLF